MADYFNHNTAFHPWIVRVAAAVGGRALDVGAGDALLLERLARVCDEVVGIEPDAASFALASERVASLSNVTLVHNEFGAEEPALTGFDLVTCVAVLHHMPLEEGIRRLGAAVRPGGKLVVVGLSANRSVADWILSALQFPVVVFVDRMRGHSAYQGVVTAEPHESFREIRGAAAALLPGATVRRRLYYRYTIRWQKPA